ncbi:MAG: tetratricopeptide repeat protein [Calditrichaeota bacterium]|nr:MAG: tetratricopeptide repeat protein [Calditrichota bacterium]
MIKKRLTISIFIFLLAWLPIDNLRGQTNDDFNRLSQVTQLPVQQRIPALKELLRAYPDWIVARYALGVAYYSIKEFQLVIPNFTIVLASGQQIENVNISEYLAVAHHEVAKKHIVAKRHKEAIPHLKAAIKLVPSNSSFYTNLGICYYNTGDYNLAKSVTQRAIKLAENSPNDQGRGYYYLGHIYNALGDFEVALNSYKRATELNPKLSNAQKYIQRIEMEQEIARLFAKASMFIETGNAADAIALLQQVIEYDPNHLEAKRLMNDAYAHIRTSEIAASKAQPPARKPEEKKAIVVRNIPRNNPVVKKTPTPEELRAEQLDGRRLEAISFFNKKDFQQAKVLFGKLLKEDPRDKISKNYLARLDSIQIENKPKLLASKTNDIIIDNPAVRSPDSAARADASKQDVQHPRRGNEIENPDTGFDRTSFLPFFFGGAFFLLIGIAAFYYFNQKKEKPKFTITEEEMRAFESRIDQSGIYDEQKVGAVASKKKAAEDDPSVHAASTHEQAIVDVVEKPDADEKSAQEEDPNVFTTSFSAQDEEDFLKLVNDEKSRPVDFQHEETGGSDNESDHTQTLEMSQFQVKKIGRYVVEKEIGRGAAGRVYKAWDPKLDRTVVIKTVSYSLTATAEEIKRLKARVYREARAAAKLSHPNIVIVYDVEDESSFSYIVMEYIQGTDLSMMLDKRQEIDRELAVKLVLQTCKALQFAHSSGVIHRDIKPSNIMIVEKNTVKVTDFGIAKITNNLTLTQTGRVVGTPSYMAPEQIEGKEVDGRADVFSLGIVLYELLTGQRPFTGDTLASLAYKLVHIDPPPPSRINEKLPKVFDEIISKSICKDPNDRFQSADEFYSALVKAKANIVS